MQYGNRVTLELFKTDLSSLGEMGVLGFVSKLFLKVPFSSRSLESCSCHTNNASLNGKNQNIYKELYNDFFFTKGQA
jgi:hypothetical protein